MRKLTVIIGIVLAAVYYADAQSFVVNNQQSAVKWTGSNLKGEHYGTINFNSGTLRVTDGAIASGVFEIDMNSIVCEDITNEGSSQRLVNHLKSDDFFSVENHPTSRMTVTGVKKLSGNEYEFTGNLTIKGITNPVTFKATTDVGESKLTAKGQMVVDRSKFDVRFGSGSFFQNLGDRLIHDDFTLDFTLVAEKQ